MKSFFKAKYLLIVEDQSRLEKVASRRFSIFSAIVAALIVMVVAMIPCFALIMLTPLHNLLPGYMKDSERALTEENIMRIDSLRVTYEHNEAYLNNLLTVFDTSRKPSDSTMRATAVNNLTPDSLFMASAAEKKFNAAVNQREKYNISVLAPLNAEGMTFYSVSNDGTISSDSRQSHRAVIFLSADSPVVSIADGRVIEVTDSPSEGASVIMAHSKGFISRLSHLGRVFAEPGDFIEGSQVLALPKANTGRDQSKVILEMWHNGTRLIPWKYVGTD